MNVEILETIITGCFALGILVIAAGLLGVAIQDIKTRRKIKKEINKHS